MFCWFCWEEVVESVRVLSECCQNFVIVLSSLCQGFVRVLSEMCRLRPSSLATLVAASGLDDSVFCSGEISFSISEFASVSWISSGGHV